MFDDWEAGLRRFLGPGGAEARRQAIDAARPVLEAAYSADAIGRRWNDLLTTPRARRQLGRARTAAQRDVGILINLPQDLDVLLPVLDEFKRRPDLRVKLIVVSTVVASSKRVLSAIIERNIIPYSLDVAETLMGDDRVVRGIDALITASETSLNPHRVAHALTKSARALGIRTFTLQHGLENVGLSYFDTLQGHATIAADHILTWADPAFLPAKVPAETRVRCKVVGRTSIVRSVAVPQHAVFEGRPVVGVFENLHWHRYSTAYRGQFVADLVSMAKARPELALLIKPHPAGKFLVKSQMIKKAPDNLLLADPSNPDWERYTAPAIIPLCRAVITTPSTVALDAAELDVPVAVARYGLDLPIYAGLRMLDEGSDWLAFVDAVLANPDGQRFSIANFRDRVRMPGDAVARIVDLVVNGKR